MNGPESFITRWVSTTGSAADLLDKLNEKKYNGINFKTKGKFN